MTGTETEPDPLLPCPAWCTGIHPSKDPHLGDRLHESRPVVLDVRTGTVSAEFQTAIVQYPPSSRPDHRGVYAWSHVTVEATLNRPSDVIGIADMLTGYARRLRELADELVIAQQDRARRRPAPGCGADGPEG